MANLFIGFPVARAKIATMIEGYAAPAFPYSEIIFHSFLESLDSWDQSTDGGGSITHDPGATLLAIGGTDADNATLLFSSDYPITPFTWDYERKFKTRVSLDNSGGKNFTANVAMGGPGGDQHIGFTYIDGIFSASVKGPGSEESYEISDWSSDLGIHELDLYVHHNPSSYPKFYVDGELVYTATSQLPAGLDDATMMAFLELKNDGTGHSAEIYVSEWMFYQKSE